MNFITAISEHGKKYPDQPAIIVPHQKDKAGAFSYQQESFASLDQRSDAVAQTLHQWGLKPGDEVLLLIKPGLAFFVVVCGLFKLGAVPIFIDPGMGLGNLRTSLAAVRPKLLIAEPAALVVRILFPRCFGALRWTITTGRWGFGLARPLGMLLPEKLSYEKSCKIKSAALPPYQADPDQLAAIIFTSGGTGRPKGVIFSHRMLAAQAEHIQALFSLGPGDKNLAGFPPFALLTITMGATSIIAPLNPSRPANADPRNILTVMQDWQVSGVNGSPAIWQKLAHYCQANRITLPSVKAVMMFGAPIAPELHEAFATILPHGTTYTPYGATECLPVSSISGRELLRGPIALSRQGRGTCIGLPVAGLEIKILRVASPTKNFQTPNNFLEADLGEVGEIAVCGPQMSRGYFGNPAAAVLSKITDEQGRLWHRMGDLGYQDREGRLWFCGRLAHRVCAQGMVFDSIPCEAIFNQHPAIRRSALICWGSGDAARPALVIERWDGRTKLAQAAWHSFQQELVAMGQGYAHTAAIKRFFLAQRFPVDTRHQIKIDRLALQRRFATHWSSS